MNTKNTVNTHKFINNLMRMDRDKLIDMIISQNNIIEEQSQNMIDIIDMTNDMTNNKLEQVSNNNDYENCIKISKDKDDLIEFYELTTNIQLILFIIVIIIIAYIVASVF
jgi:hypothetical protein